MQQFLFWSFSKYLQGQFCFVLRSKKISFLFVESSRFAPKAICFVYFDKQTHHFHTFLRVLKKINKVSLELEGF